MSTGLAAIIGTSILTPKSSPPSPSPEEEEEEDKRMEEGKR